LVSGHRFSDAAIFGIRRPLQGLGVGEKNLVIFQKRVPDLTQLALDRFVARARRATGLKGIVNVLLTSSAEMKSLNRRFRGKDRPTDVLSFPAEPDARKQFAGEIAISAEIATKNARALGHSPAEEVKILTLHGLLHLRGYDHECDNGQMARREEHLRAKLHLPLGLIERTSPRRDSRPRLSSGAKLRPAAACKTSVASRPLQRNR
jgi:probable rRNA maturation factor